jgi:AcrR family transcriptional regulator
MDTKQKIIEASIHVFTEKGYLGSSTKAISEKAQVAEVTLFRKFGTKQNLFEAMLRYTLGRELSDSSDVDMGLELTAFTKQLLHNRLTLISSHINLVRMIIQESLQGRMPNNLNFVQTMSKQLSLTFDQYVKCNKVEVKSSLCKHITGILLRYAIIDYELNYHSLPKNKQQQYLEQYLEIIKL